MSFSLAMAQEMPAELTTLLATLKKDEGGQMTALGRALLGEKGGNKLFYFPTNDEAGTPKDRGLSYEDVFFSSTEGVKLHGWLIAASKGTTLRGTVVFSHGNAGSLGHHLGFIDWLPQAGYQVMMYDYRGFGKSTGTPTREGLIADVEAAFAYVSNRKELAGAKLYSFGHSLGGAKSIVALSRTKVKGLRAVITDGAFASYEGMAEVMAGNFGKNLVSDELAPKDSVARLPVPLLIVHGTADEVVPIAQGRQLFAAAVPRKTMMEVPDGHHGDSLSRNQGEFRKKMLAWMSQY